MALGVCEVTPQKCPGLIHISFDGWTARNRLPLYGIACFFRDGQCRPLKVTIGVSELADRHTGENIAEEVYKVRGGSEYDIIPIVTFIDCPGLI